MNNQLKDKVLEMKAQLKRGDMARIVERTQKMGIEKHDVYNILNGKSLVDQQKLIIVMREVVKCIEENKRYLQEFETKIKSL